MNDVDFQTYIIAEICEYAVEHGMEPDDTLKTISENILALLKISTYNNWKQLFHMKHQRNMRKKGEC
mgnify:CR=1 FL=1